MALPITRISSEEALERVKNELGDLVTDAATNYGDVHVQCAPDNLVEVVTRLRDGAETECRFFGFVAGVDWSEFGDEDDEADQERRAKPLEVLVQLYSPEHRIDVTVRVPLDAEHPSCPSITSVFGGANWSERETAEMFGIDFVGHPSLVNLYLPEDFEGHPLRKSFVLSTRVVKQWPGAKDPDEAAAGGR